MRVKNLSAIELIEKFEELIYKEQQTTNVGTKRYKKLLSDIEDVRTEIIRRLEK